ncbi:Os10g0493300 [Oryza sativa Japonica Group]|uniref:Expressed protein n=2 Tax=Oryza sativa subsp. japonica TaxID=39947 RepID=Q9FWW1_ORYSJ|nr:unknown protein [Oryza sativa Japonica Group]AAP54411.1 expressed protein [Oryza sativa Japonica Group]BAF26852.1 Os10g0493300 [Oryza sativa Japonica Group]BAG89414.1 unnamed protein product [Oryza sativa Japonica Group]BAT11448.1 Os10g0493300 [Oryza sativa Japonica Group]|eukprot:NP_001064938.1 Os10g0493300 [Oryza sativa Japonica Group]
MTDLRLLSPDLAWPRPDPAEAAGVVAQRERRRYGWQRRGAPLWRRRRLARPARAPTHASGARGVARWSRRRRGTSAALHRWLGRHCPSRRGVRPLRPAPPPPSP